MMLLIQSTHQRLVTWRETVNETEPSAVLQTGGARTIDHCVARLASWCLLINAR